MTADAILLAVVIAWPVIGVCLWLVLGRRGHDGLGWLLLGAIFGPFAVLLAVESVEHEERLVAEVLAPPARHAQGALDVLVGFDGSSGARAAAAQAQQLFAGHIDRLTLAHVLPYDSALLDEHEARRLLEDARRTAPEVGLEVVHGRPATALHDLARRDGYDLIVVGTSRGDRVHLLGDAPVDLARRSSVPVLLVPDPRPGGEP